MQAHAIVAVSQMSAVRRVLANVSIVNETPKECNVNGECIYSSIFVSIHFSCIPGFTKSTSNVDGGCDEDISTNNADTICQCNGHSTSGCDETGACLVSHIA
jgi:hypothetical protein